MCVRIVGSEESQHLNATYRQKNHPTNVLSFPADVETRVPVLGDLAICWPVVVREADEQSKSLEDHAAHLVIHGLLHLLGFDHEDDTEAEVMEGLEISTLATLGVANPYL